jgi:formiminoglutamate deiminase
VPEGRAAWHAESAFVDGEVRDRVLIEVEGERIAAVTADADASEGATKLGGLVLPGLANVHSHAFQRALRGRVESNAGGDFWSWREEMYRVAANLDPETFQELAVAAYAEMALAGITAVGEFHYLHHAPGGTPYPDPNLLSRRLLDAARTAGIRITLLDTCYLRGGVDGRPLERAQLRFGDGSAEAWVERVDALGEGPGMRLGAAVHSVRAVDEGSIEVVARWAEARRAPLHVHLSEQPSENDECLKATGLTPARLLERAGALSARTTAVHATHASPEDVELLGSKGVSVCFCPTTERALADGIGPARSVTAAGSALCLGSDSHACIDLFEEARAVELDQRLASGKRGHHEPNALLEAATANGTRALGWDAGRLERGLLADFIAVDMGSVRTAGALREQVVFAASAADVTDVVVGGKTTVAARRHVELGDVGGLLRRAISRAVAPPGT